MILLYTTALRQSVGYTRIHAMLCDLGYVIADHIPAMMQVMTNELRAYNMELLSTKCFNTAVMMWYLFLGEREGALEYASQCDCNSVRTRGMNTRRRLSPEEFAKHPNNPAVVVDDLERALFSTSPECDGIGRELFYVILTNAELPRTTQTTAEEKKKKPPSAVQWFPGHVFVIEKSCVGSRLRFNLYQSYINKYTLQGHSLFNRSLSMSQAKMRHAMEGLRALFRNPHWTPDDTRFWKWFAHVDVHRYEGYDFASRVFACFRRADTTRCVENLRVLMQRLHARLERDLASGRAEADAPYGDSSLYTSDQGGVPVKILNNREMLGEMRAILLKV